MSFIYENNEKEKKKNNEIYKWIDKLTISEHAIV